MTHKVDDVRIREIKELAPPSHVIREFPVSEAAERVTYEARQAHPRHPARRQTTGCW